MITSDPVKREALLAEVQARLAHDSPAAEGEMLASFASLLFGQWPDRIVLGEGLALLLARVRRDFAFVAQEMPAAHQLFKGIPGLHVKVHNPDDDPHAGREGRAAFDTTVIETHTADAPFILESLKNYCRKAGLRVRSALGMVFSVRRQWERIVWIGAPQAEGGLEAYCHIEVERVESREQIQRIEQEIQAVLKCVITAVDDFPDMVRDVRALIGRLRDRRGDEREVVSAREFLEWLLGENYVFLGTVRYRTGSDGLAARAQESATGVFTDPNLLPVVFPGLLEEVESSILPAAGDTRIVDIDYCHNAQAIYHLEPIDDIAIREWAPDGSIAGITLLLGRLSLGAFAQRASDVPLLREKHDWLLAQSGDVPGSHIYREIRALFNRLPKRELFYTDGPALKELIDRMVFVSSDNDVVVFVRECVGYVSLFIAFAHSRYSFESEEALRQALCGAYGQVSFGVATDCGGTMLLSFYFDSSRLTAKIREEEVRALSAGLLTTWEDRARAQLAGVFGEREGRRLYRRYGQSLSGLYREATTAEEVAEDLTLFERLEGRIDVRVIPRTAQTATLKLYAHQTLTLSGALRTLENFGLTVAEELRVPLLLPDERRIFLYRFEVESRPERIASLSLPSGEARLRRALRDLDDGRATDGRLNALILQVGLDWREVDLIRTLRNHLMQIRLHYNLDTVNRVLLKNNTLTAALFRTFAARFDPALVDERELVVAERDRVVENALKEIQSLAEDEILRGMHGLVRACVRTNFYQRPERPVIAVKVDAQQVQGMPTPRPMFEIYVHSRLLEGIHLRGGRVARGGIRWSDRHDDFRTEILGLMKTQTVKNAVIVPVGSKGGFVLKGVLPGKPAIDNYLVERYREFVSGLLDVTDNIVAGEVIHPPDVVRRDGDDPYLVVAADKGTAHLSDTANSVSTQYGFWLGDAFASGGKNGYDHKKVGITARGVWECVKHHFHNLGHDVQRQAFTVCGIGDLAGDVFGNGMLQSRATRLVAAFNHLHIFVDPDPDPERSYVERERIFRLPASSWRDYDPALISSGGGVFERSAKAIAVSPEMRLRFDIEGQSVTGEELVRAILRARVDLLYNGGIGTYVKAADEEHADVGDRANDRVRVNGRELRARVVAEGGNLGLTQGGRLEYWRAGGVINTDALDNSGGVDMSDHEVNLKILMDLLVQRGRIESRGERNRILAELCEEVAQLVLADNANQSLSLSLDGYRSRARYDAYLDIVDELAGSGILQREDDAVPSRAELGTEYQRERGLPRPLLAVLLGHAKRWVRERLLHSDFIESQAAAPFLRSYFPARIQTVYGDCLAEHPLRREIIATGVVNDVMNHCGVALLRCAGGAANVAAAIEAYVDCEARLGARDARSRILAAQLPAESTQRLLVAVEDDIAGIVGSRLKGEVEPLSRLAGILAEL
jgi:glutamate dehydrogenase